MASLILIAEDDPHIADVLNAYLEREGFRTVCAANGQIALDLCEVLKPDLVLLDVTMPLLDGWEVLAEIRRRGLTPVIMVSALDQDIDRLQALRFGADDYVVKPFNPVEVVARTKAVLRRASPVRNSMMLRVEQVAIDLDSYQVQVDGPGGRQFPNLTLTEFRILAHLAKTPGKVYSRSELVDACLPEGDARDRTVDSHVSNLRRKLEQAGAVGLLQSIRGVGYRLAARN
jgi:two-component system response regulator AdeR